MMMMIGTRTRKGITMRYMLITACERDIETEMFEDFDTAHKVMLYELRHQFTDRGYDKDDFNNVMNNDSYTWVNDCGFAFAEFGKSYAWSNVNDDYTMDWKIVEIPD